MRSEELQSSPSTEYSEEAEARFTDSRRSEYDPEGSNEDNKPCLKLYDYGDLIEEGGRCVVDMGDGRFVSVKEHDRKFSCMSR